MLTQHTVPALTPTPGLSTNPQSCGEQAKGITPTNTVTESPFSKSRSQVRFKEFCYPDNRDAYELLPNANDGSTDQPDCDAKCIDMGTTVTIRILQETESLVQKLEVLQKMNTVGIRQIHTLFVIQDQLWIVLEPVTQDLRRLSSLLEARFPQGVNKYLTIAIAKGLLVTMKKIHQQNARLENFDINNVFIDVRSGNVMLDAAQRMRTQQPMCSDSQLIGIILLQLVTGRYTDNDQNSLLQSLQKKPIDQDVKCLVHSCLKQNSSQSVDGLLDTPILKGVFDFRLIILDEIKTTQQNTSRHMRSSSSFDWQEMAYSCLYDQYCPSSGSDYHSDKSGGESCEPFYAASNTGNNSPVTPTRRKHIITRSISQPGPLFKQQQLSSTLQRSVSSTSTSQQQCQNKPRRSFQCGRFTVTDDDDDTDSLNEVCEEVQQQVGRFKVVKDVKRSSTPTPKPPKPWPPPAKKQTTRNSQELVQMAMHQLVEIQEAQRSLADQFSVLLTAIGEAQRGRMDNLELLTQGSFVKIVQSEQLQEYKRMQQRIQSLEASNESLLQENCRLKFVNRERGGSCQLSDDSERNECD